MTQQTSKGTCVFCRARYARVGMKRHLQSCQQRISRTEHAENAPPEQADKTFLLLVEELYPPIFYWMYLAVAAENTLATLDQFLRDIWLECCGHLSAFEIAGMRYAVDEALDGWVKQRDMHIRLDEVFQPGQICTYEYDFGSTTDLRLKVLAEYDMRSAEKLIQVIARNDLSLLACNECGNAATFICSQCLSPRDGRLCERCIEKHPCDKAMPSPRINSPRAGVCGYNGPSGPFWQQFP